MDVSLESKSLPSVGYSRKSYLQVTSQRLARGKLVNLHGRRSLALPSVGPGTQEGLRNQFATTSYSRRAAKLASTLRFSASSLRHISGNFRRKSTTLYKKVAKSLRKKRVISQHFCKMLPSAWSDLLAMAVTPSFQLRIAHRLKHWILDFLSFQMWVLHSSIKRNLIAWHGASVPPVFSIALVLVLAQFCIRAIYAISTFFFLL
ncbi:hypothetical protein CK203_038901 [Vitis vinifera]|uniref:Uncharacterized protein n=1 Tax=Vitis vinifera TaxID=29760 RepID=A0A438HFX9_VITVI|nr:hypothetical protein CK203_038901 [Vitis vinifera]